MSDSIVVGLDVDSKTLVVAVHGQDRACRIDNTAGGIKKWMSELPANCRIGVEATNRYHDQLVRLAQDAGHTVFVLNPRDIKHYAKACKRGKTDSSDAQVIARYVAREGEDLHEHVPLSPAQHALKVLQQQRGALVQARASLQLSLNVKAGKVGRYGGLFQGLNEALAALDKDIQRLCLDGQYGDVYRRMLTIPGVGPVVAACLTHHITRWPLASVNAWVACTGLDPRPNESGARVGKRRLSKRGDAGLRQMLYMAAMGLTRSRKGRPLYEHIRSRGHSSTASFNILARKLARIAWGVLKSKRDFDPALLSVGELKFGAA